MDKLSNIVKQFNDQFGGLFADAKRMEQRITGEIPQKVAADERYQNARKNSDRQNAKIEKIQTALSLPSLQEALFELTKGKFTTDPSRHTGEGIFFTSRAFDAFRLLSSGLFLTHARAGDDWLSGTEDSQDLGTYVRMTIAADSPHTMQEVFEHYSSERDDYGFNNTNVILRLLDWGDDSFVSRSQAKRVLARLPRFKEVVLDFEGVATIGPAFADEIFRVFAKGHPDVHLSAARAREEVARMIARARAAAAESERTNSE